FGEDTRDAEFVKWFVEDDVASRFYCGDFGFVAEVVEFAFNGAGLPECEFAIARADSDDFHRLMVSMPKTFRIQSMLSSTIVSSSFRWLANCVVILWMMRLLMISACSSSKFVIFLRWKSSSATLMSFSLAFSALMAGAYLRAFIQELNSSRISAMMASAYGMYFRRFSRVSSVICESVSR